MEERLWKACSDGKVEEVIKLLQNSQININWQDPELSRTPFFRACGYSGHIEIVKLLLNDKRVDVNKVNKYEATPFLIACQEGRIEIVKILLNDKRIDICKVKNDGATPFWQACYQGHIDIVEILLNDNRVDINQAENNGATPFWIACQNGHIDIVKYLLACGREIDINKKWNNTKTPLDISKQRSTSTLKFNNETEEQFQKAKKNCPKIIELIESFQRNPTETRAKLRKELGILGKFILFLLLFI